jgi:hypothetical protein
MNREVDKFRRATVTPHSRINSPRPTGDFHRDIVPDSQILFE